MAQKTIEQLEAEIAALEARIANEPQRIIDEQDRKLTVMPAPDELVQQEREKKHKLEYTRGQVENIRMSQAKDGVLLLFFLVALAAIGCWIFNAFQQM